MNYLLPFQPIKEKIRLLEKEKWKNEIQLTNTSSQVDSVNSLWNVELTSLYFLSLVL